MAFAPKIPRPAGGRPGQRGQPAFAPRARDAVKPPARTLALPKGIAPSRRAADVALAKSAPRAGPVHAGEASDGPEHAPEHPGRAADRLADRAMSGMLVQPRSGAKLRLAPSAPGGAAGAARDLLGGGGQPLDPASRGFFEPRFKRDLSDVRVHAGPQANAAAERLSARAFAVGPHVAFAAGEHDPGSHAGRSLMAHELAHVAQPPSAEPVIKRQPKPESHLPDKPEIVAIGAQYGALAGEARLSTGATASVSLKRNTEPVGRWRLLRGEGHQYHAEPSPGADRSFVWINPYVPGSKQETRYAWADAVDVTIAPDPKASPAQRIEALPDTVRRFLTTGRGPQADASDLESVAAAGELLADAGFSAEEAALLAERAEAAKERGEPLPSQDPFEWAQAHLEEKREKKAAGAKAAGDLLGFSNQQLADEPLDLMRDSGTLKSLVDSPSDKLELADGIMLARRYGLKQVPGADQDQKDEYLRDLARQFRKKMCKFEELLVGDITNRASQSLESAEGAIARMRALFVRSGGKWASASVLWAALQKIRANPDVQHANDLRQEAAADIDRETWRDLHTIPAGPMVARAAAEAAYQKREDIRDARRKLVERVFAEVVRGKTGLAFPPNAGTRNILEAPDRESAYQLLVSYLYDARDKIGKAQGKLKDEDFIFAADNWLGQEKTWLRQQLAGDLGENVAALADSFTRFRKSQTSIWEDLLRVVEFVSMFIPGPVGWVLRAGTSIYEFSKEMDRLATQATLAGVDASMLDPSSGEAFKALIDLAVGMVPDASVFGEAKAEGGLAKQLGGGEHLPGGERPALPSGEPAPAMPPHEPVELKAPPAAEAPKPPEPAAPHKASPHEARPPPEPTAPHEAKPPPEPKAPQEAKPSAPKPAPPHEAKPPPESKAPPRDEAPRPAREPETGARPSAPETSPHTPAPAVAIGRAAAAAAKRRAQTEAALATARRQAEAARRKVAAALGDLQTAETLAAEAGRSAEGRALVKEAKKALTKAEAALRPLAISERTAELEQVAVAIAESKIAALEADVARLKAEEMRELRPTKGSAGEAAAKAERRPAGVPPPTGAQSPRYRQLQSELKKAQADLAEWEDSLDRTLREQKAAATPGAAGRPSAMLNAESLPDPLRPVGGKPIDVTTGRPIEGSDWTTDHIMSRDEIANDPRWARLTPIQRDEILLDIPENYLPMTGPANESKGAKTVGEWISYRERTGNPLPSDVAKALEVADERARKAIEAFFQANLPP